MFGELVVGESVGWMFGCSIVGNCLVGWMGEGSKIGTHDAEAPRAQVDVVVSYRNGD